LVSGKEWRIFSPLLKINNHRRNWNTWEMKDFVIRTKCLEKLSISLNLFLFFSFSGLNFIHCFFFLLLFVLLWQT
jgi:hypothetical protein